MLAALPGIREIRSALASGYLWLLFIWLLLDPGFHKSQFESEPWRSVHHLGDALGPVVIGVAVTFVAYLLGTLIDEGRGVLSRVYLRARQRADGYAQGPSHEALERVRLSRQATRDALDRQWQRATESLRSTPQGNDPKPQKSQPDVGRARKSAPPWLRQMEGATQRLLEGFSRSIPAFGALSANFIGYTMQSLVSFTNAIFHPFEEALLRGVGILISVRIEPYAPFLTKLGVKTLEDYLHRLPAVPGRGKPDVAAVIADFPILRMRLLSESIDTVNEVDRLRAEADFRAAIAPPLLALTGVMVYGVSAWWLFAAPPLLALWTTARVRTREAGDLLADVVGREAVVPPSVDSYLSGN
jgi:hypothetical protein